MSNAVAGFRFLPQRHLLFMGNMFFRDVFDSTDVSVYTYTVTTSWTDFLQHTIHFTPYETLAFSHGRAFHFSWKNIFPSLPNGKCQISVTALKLCGNCLKAGMRLKPINSLKFKRLATSGKVVRLPLSASFYALAMRLKQGLWVFIPMCKCQKSAKR